MAKIVQLWLSKEIKEGHIDLDFDGLAMTVDNLDLNREEPCFRYDKKFHRVVRINIPKDQAYGIPSGGRRERILLPFDISKKQERVCIIHEAIERALIRRVGKGKIINGKTLCEIAREYEYAYAKRRTG